MKERTLKAVIFIMMVLAKIIILAWILFHYQTGGLEKSEAVGAVVLILPLFTVYLTVIVKDMLSNPYKSMNKKEQKPLRVKGFLPVLTFIIFPVYFIAIIWAVAQTARGNFDSVGLQQTVGIIESVFGVYIGQIVFTLFKKTKETD